jgi:hypothetical protein
MTQPRSHALSKASLAALVLAVLLVCAPVTMACWACGSSPPPTLLNGEFYGGG